MTLSARPADIFFEVDDAAFVRETKDTENDLDRLIMAIALDLARNLADEGGKHAEALGAPWEISGIGPHERKVSAPEWWAHFVAGGTADHGPVSAAKLSFTIDGEGVFVDQVRGVAATHFDEAAIARSRSHVDEIARRTIT